MSEYHEGHPRVVIAGLRARIDEARKQLYWLIEHTSSESGKSHLRSVLDAIEGIPKENNDAQVPSTQRLTTRRSKPPDRLPLTQDL